MFEAVKSVIKSGTYDLMSLLTKINVLWVQGDLTDAQKEELIHLAQEGASAKNSVDIMSKLAEHDKALQELRQQVKSIQLGDDSEEEPSDSAAEEYIEGKWYYAGDRITFEGKEYTCIAPDGVVCVWSPKGHPAYWEVKDDG